MLGLLDICLDVVFLCIISIISVHGIYHNMNLIYKVRSFNYWVSAWCLSQRLNLLFPPHNLLLHLPPLRHHPHHPPQHCQVLLSLLSTQEALQQGKNGFPSLVSELFELLCFGKLLLQPTLSLLQLLLQFTDQCNLSRIN